MLEITCRGTPYEIGLHHGYNAKDLIRENVTFYSQFFQDWSKVTWVEATTTAQAFLPYLKRHVPHLVEEMNGIAHGSGLEFSDILTLNSRSEIAMGMLTDGCTTVAWKTDMFCVAGQNWDWDIAQKSRLVLQHIIPVDGTKPRISQATEAGLLSKSGINSKGVAVFLNAIPQRGISLQALPIHIALREALEAVTREDAISRITELGIATAGNILVADETGGTCLESSHADLIRLEMTAGQIAHTNHFVVRHSFTPSEKFPWPDTKPRLDRAAHLLEAYRSELTAVTDGMKCIEHVLEDEDGFPAAINRCNADGSNSATLFSIVSNLSRKSARLRLGRPSAPEGIWDLNPAEL
ncbi:hypothetical protein LMH87_009794 [Akanthomyces muscarius]|uniref:Peptidase C45 hydrolase domain-containing protein n=1 Tax=Akanthomyces muscarius TaxID=2231603 RepID=A0A9W8QCP9_AKAMU|nr:hypothetical protein LMH87_009794 [Akanthomyces muscarius]KAJ4153302.1 hypothetical protein LMH87_009794 [Akanthomyces muscarius]